jgi:NADPH-ferrihemoprotein reductase
LATVAAVAQQEEKEKEDADEGDSNVPAALLEPGRLELHWLAGDAASACASERAQDRWRAARIETELKGYTAEAPFLGRLAAARFLTRVGAEKHVLHLEVEPPRSGSEQVLFNPGDSLGVFCPNDEEVVAALLRRLRVTEPDRRFEFRRTSSGLSDEARARHRAQRRQQVLARRRERGAREGEGADRPEAPPPPLPSPPAPVSTAAPPIEAKAAFGERVMVGHVAEATTPREALLFFFDLSSPPRKALLRVLAEHCSDEKEREALLRLCSHQGTEEYERKIVEPRLTLLEVLAAHPSSAPPLARVLEHLGPAQPRYYSVSASPFASQSRIQLALTVVDVERGGRRVLGLCSTWLYRLACFAGLIAPADDAYAQGCALRGLTPPAPPSAGRLPAGCCADPRGGVCVPMFLRRARDFALPEDARRPLVLVGPGTGVAPFRAFLQHRDAQRRALAEGGESVGFWRGLEVVEDSASEHSRRGSPPTAAAMGHVLLFFGCRDPELDFLYRQDLEELCAAGRGATLVTAFSRQPGQPRVYVQDRLREHGKIVARLLLEENAAVFVCGDGAAMAKDLARAVQEVLAQHGGPSAADAEGLLARLVREHRYVQEIWS